MPAPAASDCRTKRSAPCGNTAWGALRAENFTDLVARCFESLREKQWLVNFTRSTTALFEPSAILTLGGWKNGLGRRCSHFYGRIAQGLESYFAPNCSADAGATPLHEFPPKMKVIPWSSSGSPLQFGEGSPEQLRQAHVRWPQSLGLVSMILILL